MYCPGIQIPIPKPKVQIGSTKLTDNLFARYCNDIIEHPNRQIRLSFRFGNNNSCVFPSRSLNYTGINLFLQKFSTLTIVKFTTSTRTDITLQTSVKKLRAIAMFSALTLDCEYDNSTIILIGDVYCPNTKWLGKLCLHRKPFQYVNSDDYQRPQCACVCQLGNINFEDQTNSFFLSFGQGVYIFKGSPKSI